MVSAWPVFREDRVFEKDEASVEIIKECVRAVRTVRTAYEVPPSRKAKVFCVSQDEEVRKTIEGFMHFFTTLAQASEAEVLADREGVPQNAVSQVISRAVIWMPLEDLVDVEKERARLSKEKDRLLCELARSEAMLKNPKFLEKAPKDKVEAEQEKHAKYESMLKEVEGRLAAL